MPRCRSTPCSRSLLKVQYPSTLDRLTDLVCEGVPILGGDQLRDKGGLARAGVADHINFVGCVAGGGQAVLGTQEVSDDTVVTGRGAPATTAAGRVGPRGEVWRGTLVHGN